MATNNQITRYQNPQPDDQNQYGAQNQYDDASASQNLVSYYSTPYPHQYQTDRPDSQYGQLAPQNPETFQHARPNQSRYQSPPPERNEYADDRTTSSRRAHDDHGRPRRPWEKQDRASDTQRVLEKGAGNIVPKTKKRKILKTERERETKHYERQQEESGEAPVDRQGRSRGDVDDGNHCGEEERAGRVHWG
ncbi:predicted protein [Sclerotinia sclerotiorum 1980 UF-70]|uniref:Uncharacterized protein n=2 Tax=Sclerotinia sclerotiorum (strain ATCC 18683 / 1980 / Ss-1) TaxID=665079 RepID=A7E488_SCLS1|nr:predicted protein [Sclerotinia sclerotiorum 1980 UF-70]APA08192.1 hypothetical protein sscle_03g029620 [Sclerotinia sclerotiorum 1980 UF-70]EDN90710.1 predicted protein [Sclerotinia sclerotiorum 1980 UF-70]